MDAGLRLASSVAAGEGDRCRWLRDGVLGDGDCVVVWLHHAVRGREHPAIDTAVALAESAGCGVVAYLGLGGRHPYNNDRHLAFMLQGWRDAAEALMDRGIGVVGHAPSVLGAGSPLPRIGASAAAVVTEEWPLQPISGWTERLPERLDRASGWASGGGAEAGVCEAHGYRPPVVAVDCACLVPMRSLGERFIDRAFRFREAIEGSWRASAVRGWAEPSAPAGGLAHAARLREGFGLIDPASIDDAWIEGYIASLAVDHAVPVVAHTRGGSRAAERRWRAFSGGDAEPGGGGEPGRGSSAAGSGGLFPIASYHERRNDAGLGLHDDEHGHGVSRMSAYLHHGHMSPWRLARGALSRGPCAGATKFLDELVVWRELAFHYALHHTADLGTLAALPGWARQTLAEHAGDPRAVLDGERLARGDTGDAFWDAAQASLVVHGELHNNVRMTWGKALAGWTRGPAEAQAAMHELNHRFALDGSDPNSHAGLDWCLGALDRPFKPESSVLGRVRGRDTKTHAARLSPESYGLKTRRPAGPRLRVLVVGAGVAGSAAARLLADQGHGVTVVEKSRGPGGRTATRRAEVESEAWRFDHGAWRIGVSDERFALAARAWTRHGVLAPWKYRVLEENGAAERDCLTPTPDANALVRHLLAGLEKSAELSGAGCEVRYGGRVERLTVEDGGGVVCVLAGGERLDGFDAAVLTAPGPQTAALVEGLGLGWAGAVGSVEYAARHAAMVAFAGPVLDGEGREIDALRVRGGVLAEAHRTGAKPGRERGGRDGWVLHAGGAWSGANLETPFESIAAGLISAFREAVEARGGVVPGVVHSAGHRWKYAAVARAMAGGAVSAEFGAGECVAGVVGGCVVAAAGDWCLAPRPEAGGPAGGAGDLSGVGLGLEHGVERAYLSGVAAGARVIALRGLGVEAGGG